MLCLKQENVFRWLDIEQKLHCLTTLASVDAKQSIIRPKFYGTTTNSPVRCSVAPIHAINRALSEKPLHSQQIENLSTNPPSAKL